MVEEAQSGRFDQIRELFEEGKVPAAWKENAENPLQIHRWKFADEEFADESLWKGKGRWQNR